MGIFNLTQNSNEISEGLDTALNKDTTSAVVTAEGDDTNKDLVKEGSTEELTEANAATGETKDITDKQTQTIVLDGPLSHVYTQALNLAYANEGTSSMVSLLEAKHSSVYQDNSESDRVEAGNSVTADGTYVYCIDSTDLDNDGLVLSTESLRQAISKYKTVVLAMESGRVVSSKMQLLEEMGTTLGVSVYHSRARALQAVLNLPKGV